ncbi:MAG TPA: ABC transporter ATP-binding protein [Acidimicrobiales bacterium]|jgi:ABC-2 type transport system ATP-binding protein
MPAIVVESVSKKFRLSGHKVRSIKEGALRLGRNTYEEFWALKDISLTIDRGETIGILGHNGSGKSTLLKCISGILKPTTGEVRLRGRIASLLELGAGFHPDLTGRENVYINASFLGIPKKEIAKHFDDIVAFAELEHFIDQQVKYYSSGMYVRLGFAVAINVEPDILLVDEVLAVGDEVFQKKCIDRVEELQTEGKTILFVTHAADLARKICDRVIVLDHGDMVANGVPGESIRIFREYLHGHLTDSEDAADTEIVHSHDPRVQITSVTFEHPGQPDRRHVFAGEPLTIRVGIEAVEPIADAVLGLEVRDTSGEVLYVADTEMLGAPLPPLVGAVEVAFNIGSLPLLDGAFPISIQLKDRHGGRLLDFREGQDAFEVVNPTRAGGSILLPVSVETTEPVIR